MNSINKLIKNLEAGDKIYYLPGRSVSDGTETITEETVLKVEREIKNGSVRINIFLEGFHNGEYPEISYNEMALRTDSFFDKYGYYSTRKGGIEELVNNGVHSNIQYLHDDARSYINGVNNSINRLQKEFIGSESKESTDNELMVVPKKLLEDLMRSYQSGSHNLAYYCRELKELLNS